MKGDMDERCVMIGEALVESGETIRQLAKRFGVCKSTVHKDLTERLPEIDLILAKKVREKIDANKAERHIRGGAATREKYKGTTFRVIYDPKVR